MWAVTRSLHDKPNKCSSVRYRRLIEDGNIFSILKVTNRFPFVFFKRNVIKALLKLLETRYVFRRSKLLPVALSVTNVIVL